MKKAVFCILMVLCMLFALVACGTSTQGDVGEQPDSNVNDSTKEDGFVFISVAANNYAVSIDADMADVLAVLGEPNSYFEAASCAFDGLDKSYTYSGFVISTRPDGEKDFINSILLTDDSVTTPEGIYLGSTAEQVIAAYGEGEQIESVIQYTKGNTMLNILLEDDKVVSIEYLPA